MTEFIENEFLLPSLTIGIPEEVFWKLQPKTLGLYFKAYKERKELENKEWCQRMWMMGQYVRMAISTTVTPAGLYDGKHKLPDYPECPYIKDENNPEEMSEAEKERERMRLYAYLKTFGSHK